MNAIPGKLTTVGLLLTAFLLSAVVAMAGAGDQPGSPSQPVEERPLNLFPTTIPTTLGPTKEATNERLMPIEKHPPASLSRRIIERMILIGTSSYGMVNPDAYEQRPGELPPARSR